jgi:hypothetical protein
VPGAEECRAREKREREMDEGGKKVWVRAESGAGAVSALVFLVTDCKNCKHTKRKEKRKRKKKKIGRSGREL